MTANKRILLNIAATYGRSLYGLVLGLFCGRWVLMSLGQVDYGLIGVVGGLTGFVSFFNGLLASAVGRFYAVNVGAAKKEGNEIAGLEECRKWFNTAVFIHSVVPLVLIVVGYPIGVWAVRHFLSIPPDRIVSCVWVWRFTCLSCFVAMANVPYQAMYLAKQEIAEQTVYTVVAMTVNVLFVSYMVTHPSFWLTRYAGWQCFVAIAPQLALTTRALMRFPECRFRTGYMIDKFRICEIIRYAFARFWTALSTMFAHQGSTILVNKYLGAAINASMSIGSTVSSQAASLSSALSGAFWPAIANTAGMGDKEKTRRLSFMTCRIGSLLLMVFAVPLLVEIDEILRLWLKTPPDRLSLIVFAVLTVKILERMSEGYWMAIMAFGNGIGKYSWYVSWSDFFGFFLAWALFAMGFGVEGLCSALILAQFMLIGIRLVLGRSLAGLSAHYWIFRVFVPIVTAGFLSYCAGYALRLFLGVGFWRIAIETVVCELVLLPCVWFGIFEQMERDYLRAKFAPVIARFRKR